MSKFTRIYFATLSVYSIFWVFAIWFFENNGTTIIKVLATIALSLIAIAGVFVVFQYEDKENEMKIKGTLLDQHLHNCFPNSFINESNEFICLLNYRDKCVNSYFKLDNVSNELELKCMVLEYLSRPAFKGFTYAGQPLRNREIAEEIYSYHLKGINCFLGTHFTTDDIEIIYSELGNGRNRKLCIDFIEKGYDINILKDKGE